MAKSVVSNVIKIHSFANYNIRNYISNSTEFINSIPESKRLENKITLGDNEQLLNEKILAIYWDTEPNTINFNFKVPNSSDLPSKTHVGTFYNSEFMLNQSINYFKIMVDKMSLKSSNPLPALLVNTLQRYTFSRITTLHSPDSVPFRQSG